MKAFEITQTVNLRAQNAVKVYEQPLVYGNKGAHRWIVDVLDGRESADLTGCTAVLYISRQDGKTVKITDGITIAAKRAEVLLPAEAYAVEGGTAFELDILEGGRTITCAQLSAIVRRTRTNDVIIPGTGEIYDLPDLLAQIDAMKAATEAANTAAANANAKATAADTATANATTATGIANAGAENANKAAAKLNGLTIAATGLETGSAPTAALSEVDGHYHIALGIPKGDTGATPQIAVEVSTGAPGSEAQVSVSGTAENPVIHLTIPRGDVGAIENLTINGKTPDGSETVTLEMSDIPGLSDAISAHEASIGDAWTSGTTYAVGDYAIYGNRLYKCKTEHTAGDEFGADYWDTVSVSSEVKGISAEINANKEKAEKIKYYCSESKNTNIALFSNVEIGMRLPALFIGNANGTPVFDYCALFKLGGYDECAITGTSGFSISSSDNSDGTADISISGVPNWGYYRLIVFYV